MIDILTASLCTNLRHPAPAPDRFRRADVFRALTGLVLLVSIFAALSNMDQRNPRVQESGLMAKAAR